MKWYEDKIYHLMCKKAIEIQKPYSKYVKGDFFLDHAYGVSIYGCGSGTYCAEPKPIWLPRQDQLQGMIEDKPSPYLFAKFMTFLGWNGKIYKTQYPMVGIKFTSMEQLWLAFVMKERFGKIWDGEEWILQNQ
jgi:hypothetical protein